MDVSLPYGPTTVVVRVPDGAEVVAPPPAPAAGDEAAIVAAALDAPTGAPPLVERARGARRVVVVVPDRTRPARTAIVVGPILARLAAAGVPRDGISFLVGGGLHACATPDERAAIVGPAVAAAHRVDAADADDAAAYGDLPKDVVLGTPRVHRAVLDADLVVATGAVAPHYLAGFSGGAKGLVVGCGDRATVAAAHRATLDATVALDGSLRARLARPEGNPFAATLLRVGRTIEHVFLVNVGLAGGRIAHAAAGDVGGAHEAAWRTHRARFACPRPAAADLVVAGCGEGRDGDLVQAHKALVVAAEVARPGAAIVWLAHAAGGPGHPRFLPWFEAGRPERHLAALRRDFHPYGLTAYALRWKTARFAVHAVSTQPADVLRPMGLWPFRDPQAAVDHATAGRAIARCVVLPRAAETFFA